MQLDGMYSVVVYGERILNHPGSKPLSIFQY